MGIYNITQCPISNMNCSSIIVKNVFLCTEFVHICFSQMFIPIQQSVWHPGNASNGNKIDEILLLGYLRLLFRM